jgi:hypothetical protein
MIAPFFNNVLLGEVDIQQIIEIPISGPGQLTSFETASLTDMHEITGIALINPNPAAAGHGTLRLRIGDNEILPNGFHAGLIAKYSHRYVSTKVEFGFKEYILPVKTKAEGKPVKITYTEAGDGGNGRLYLYLLGKKSSCSHNVPEYRFQVIDIDIPQGNNSNDIELVIDEKTLLGHKQVKGVMLYGITNRLKKLELCIDDSSIFPEDFKAQLVAKEMVTNTIITDASGIFLKHIIPMCYIIHPVSLKAQNSKIEGKLWSTPHPDISYKVYLYLLTSV